MNPQISLIAAIDEKNGLGKNNDLLFKIHRDLKRFREKTNGHPIIMGRKTFDSLHMPNGLPNRLNIVLSRDPNKHIEKIVEETGVYFRDNLDQALDMAREWIKNKSEESDEIFIIGGGQIFKEAIEKDLVDRLYLTIVKGDYHADTFFPDYSMFKTVLNREEHEEDGYTYTFLDLEK